jgi:hypothetical protein
MIQQGFIVFTQLKITSDIRRSPLPNGKVKNGFINFSVRILGYISSEQLQHL